MFKSGVIQCLYLSQLLSQTIIGNGKLISVKYDNVLSD